MSRRPPDILPPRQEANAKKNGLRCVLEGFSDVLSGGCVCVCVCVCFGVLCFLLLCWFLEVYGPCRAACQILAPRTGIKLSTPAREARTPSHQASRALPVRSFLRAAVPSRPLKHTRSCRGVCVCLTAQSVQDGRSSVGGSSLTKSAAHAQVHFPSCAFWALTNG